MVTHQQRVKILRDIGVTVLSAAIIIGAFAYSRAGTLDPNSLPASTMHDLQEQYSVLVGTFDSSATIASDHGSLLQVSHCIEQKIIGGTCP